MLFLFMHASICMDIKIFSGGIDSTIFIFFYQRGVISNFLYFFSNLMVIVVCHSSYMLDYNKINDVHSICTNFIMNRLDYSCLVIFNKIN